MTAIRIAVAAVLATAAVFAGGATAAWPSVHAYTHPSTFIEASPIPCCEER